MFMGIQQPSLTHSIRTSRSDLGLPVCIMWGEVLPASAGTRQDVWHH